ncbi:MAG: hypothetical protein ACI3VU_03200 [Faecousia sp.]
MFLTKFTVKPNNGFAVASMLLMALSAVLRLIYYPQKALSCPEAWLYLYLPLLSAVLFIVFLLLWGRRTLVPLCLPVAGGVAFFILKAFTFASPLHTALCCVLYGAVLVLTCLIFCGILRIKYLLYPLFALPLLVHAAMDIHELFFAAERTPLSEFPSEASALCIMASLLCLAIAMEKPFHAESQTNHKGDAS